MGQQDAGRRTGEGCASGAEADSGVGEDARRDGRSQQSPGKTGTEIGALHTPSLVHAVTLTGTCHTSAHPPRASQTHTHKVLHSYTLASTDREGTGPEQSR